MGVTHRRETLTRGENLILRCQAAQFPTTSLGTVIASLNADTVPSPSPPPSTLCHRLPQC
jgi:hypothetical protein